MLTAPYESPVLEQEAQASIRVLLVDDNAMVRHTLKQLLQDYPDIDVVGEAATGEDAIVGVKTLQPTVVVMDIRMPKMDGIAATREIRVHHPDVKVVGLSQYGEGYLVDAMEKAGARGVYKKDNAREELYPAIRSAAAT
jgi:DNA-binding NarL/FixJ family response regulator